MANKEFIFAAYIAQVKLELIPLHKILVRLLTMLTGNFCLKWPSRTA